MRTRGNQDAMTAYTPPAPAFEACACGTLILRRVWVHGTKDTPPTWRTLPEPLTPMGKVHQCAGAPASTNETS